MSLASEYRRQFAWRDWSTLFDNLPALAGQRVLDLGCGVGDHARELVARGADVIGIDANDELLHEARSRQLARAEFRRADLRQLPDLGVTVDGFWCSFAAAYFVDLSQVLASWKQQLRSGGWVALTEVDDLFGHEPLAAWAKSLLDTYAGEAFVAGRYDFHMGRKLEAHLQRAGFVVSEACTIADRELSFQGPAPAEVIDGWRARLDRMQGLRQLCGSQFELLRTEFLGCLGHADHTCRAKVYFCIATSRA
jgi:ubiquinone/menaquinone biosynthesis C-methylase UbiE